MTTATGAMGVDDNAPALSMTLEPPRPGAKWFRADRRIAVGPGSGVGRRRSGAGRRSRARVAGRQRPGQRSAHRSAGPRRRRIVARTVACGGAQRERRRATGWRPGSRISCSRRRRGTKSARSAGDSASRRPQLTDTAVHVQSTWERRDPAPLTWRVFGGYTERSRTTPVTSDRGRGQPHSDPVSDLIDTGAGTARRWLLGARWRHAAAAASHHRRRSRTRSAARRANGIDQIGELVDGVPARLWTLHAGGGTAVRHLTTLAVHGNEHLTFRRLTLDAGVRLEAVTGAADAARPGGSVDDLAAAHDAAVADHRHRRSRAGRRLPAIGVSASPERAGDWRSGGSGRRCFALERHLDRSASSLASDRAPAAMPRSRKSIRNCGGRSPMNCVLAIESRPLRGLQVRAGARHEARTAAAWVRRHRRALVRLLPRSRCRIRASCREPRFGAPLVTVYNRPPGSYGRDRYLLTNQAGDPARFWGLELTVRASTDRFTLLFGGTPDLGARACGRRRLPADRERSGRPRQPVRRSERRDLRARPTVSRTAPTS